MQQEKAKRSANVSSIDKAFAIIDSLHQKGGEASINEISKGLDMYKSTVYRVLNAVKAAGYIYQNEETADYGLSIRFYQIGLGLQRNGTFLRAYVPYARALNEKYNEVITIAARDLAVNDTPEYVEVCGFHSSHALTMRFSAGERSPSYCTASGKCLLAYSDERYLKQYETCELQPRTPYTITNWAQMRIELQRVRDMGYAIDHEEYELGLMGIATPLFAPNGSVVGALSLTLPTERFHQLNFDLVIADMKAITELRLEI